jgi:hypothetical protein
MDDGRVNQVHINEVLEAEAYMLFYQVVQHPVTQELKEVYRNMKNQEKEEKALKEMVVVDDDSADCVELPTVPPLNTLHGVSKRKRRTYESGSEWAKNKTKLPPHMISIMHKLEELIVSDVQLAPEFFRRLSEAVPVDGLHDVSSVSSSSDKMMSNSVPSVVRSITGTQYLAEFALSELIPCS